MNSPSYSTVRPSVDAAKGGIGYKYRLPVQASGLDQFCESNRTKCEWLERGPKCGWHGDELTRNSDGYLEKCPDCLAEGAPPRSEYDGQIQKGLR
jgi:hypothetical protein